MWIARVGVTTAGIGCPSSVDSQTSFARGDSELQRKGGDGQVSRMRAHDCDVGSERQVSMSSAEELVEAASG